MEEWKEYKLGELSIGKGSYGIGASAVPYNPLLHTYLRITDINDDGTLNKNGLMSLDDENADEYILQPNDIVFARTGNSTGRSYFYDGSDGKLVYAGFLIKFSLDSKKVNPRILKYYTHSKPYFDWVRSFDTGGTRGNINAKTYGDMPIVLPPRKLQDKIVSILKSLDDKIEVNRKINENLEQQAQALFKSWFVDFEPFKNGEFVESELGMIPKGWRVGTLDAIIKEAESGSRPKGGAETDGVPSIGAEKIERFGVYDYSSEKYINNNYYVQMKRGHVKEGDVLLYKDGAYTGKSSMALDGFPYKECAVNEHVFLLRTEASRFQFYLYFLISYPDIKTMIHTLASAKAAQPGLNQKELLGLDITIPNEDIIKQFNNLISPYMHQIANNANESRRLAELRDTLLPKLMSGELKVTNMDLVNEMLEKGIR